MEGIRPVSPDQELRRDEVLRRIREATMSGETVRYDPGPEGRFAGEVGVFSYVFEGEDDLLHLAVFRRDGQAVRPEEGQAVARFVLRGVPPGLVWFKPGATTQHFYIGHDDLP
jgi:hypothetical protein